jgi:hypothetical protein
VNQEGRLDLVRGRGRAGGCRLLRLLKLGHRVTP